MIKNYEEMTGFKDLLPFARNGEWAACFNLADKSINPQIIVIDLDNPSHYEIFKNFDAWLKEAENDGW